MCLPPPFLHLPPFHPLSFIYRLSTRPSPSFTILPLGLQGPPLSFNYHPSSRTLGSSPILHLPSFIPVSRVPPSPSFTILLPGLQGPTLSFIYHPSTRSLGFPPLLHLPSFYPVSRVPPSPSFTIFPPGLQGPTLSFIYHPSTHSLGSPSPSFNHPSTRSLGSPLSFIYHPSTRSLGSPPLLHLTILPPDLQGPPIEYELTVMSSLICFRAAKFEIIQIFLFLSFQNPICKLSRVLISLAILLLGSVRVSGIQIFIQKSFY